MESHDKIKSFLKVVSGFLEKNYVILFSINDYKDSNSPLLVKCKNGHESKIRWSRIKNKNSHHCKFCSLGNNGKNKWTLNDARVLFEKESYTLLASGYKNVHTKMPARCEKEHEVFINLKHFKNGVRCAQCKKFKTEEHCRSIIEKYTGCLFPKVRPEWLINPNTGRKLELDGYSQILGIAFEYDGEFHFVNSRVSQRNLSATNKQKNAIL